MKIVKLLAILLISQAMTLPAAARIFVHGKNQNLERIGNDSVATIKTDASPATEAKITVAKAQSVLITYSAYCRVDVPGTLPSGLYGIDVDILLNGAPVVPSVSPTADGPDFFCSSAQGLTTGVRASMTVMLSLPAGTSTIQVRAMAVPNANINAYLGMSTITVTN
jgi:hypothetical protein